MRVLLRSARLFRCALFIAICAIVLGAVPAHPVAAAINKTLSVDNSLADFSRGTFQRSSLAAIRSNNSKLPDQVGALQIAPVGIIKNWRTAIDLPIPLQQMGTAVYGNRLFVIGGQTSASNNTVIQNTNQVWSNLVSTDNGALLNQDWDTEPALNALVSRRGDTATYDKIAAPAVTLMKKSDGSGAYLYVIGGNVIQGTIKFSSYAVHVATINSAGRITAWSSAADIPGPDLNPTFGKNGLEAASAVNYTIGGKTYIYLFGGLERYLVGSGSGGQTEERHPSKNVFYAEVGSNGKLYKPGTNQQTEGWKQLTTASIPDFPSDPGGDAVGLYNSAAVLADFPTGDGTSHNSIYLVGGQREDDPARYTSLVRQAIVKTDGTLEWQGSEYTLGTPRFGLGAVEFRGTMYVTGGRAGNATDPDNTVQTTVINDGMELEAYGTGNNFLPDNPVNLPARMWHGSQIVKNDAGTGFIYVMGGRGPRTGATPTDASLISKQIFYAKFGTDEDLTKGYPASARFYSKAYPIVFEGADIKEINWSTVMSTSTAMDVQISYRVSNANNCSNPGWSDTDWKDLTSQEATSGNAGHYSANGKNTVPIQSQLIAKCFQYRATLFAGFESNTPKFTPSLLNVGIIVRVPGSPDLKVKDPTQDPDAFKARFNTRGQFTGLSVKLINKNDQTAPPDNVTQDANAEEPGTFFVDLYLFGPGQTIVEPTVPYSPNGPDPVACVQLDKSLLPAKGEYSIASWRVSDATCQGTAVDVRTLITKPGKYTVFVAVDTACASTGYGCVNERDALNGETNNVSKLEFTIPDNGLPPTAPDDILLPIVKFRS